MTASWHKTSAQLLRHTVTTATQGKTQSLAPQVGGSEEALQLLLQTSQACLFGHDRAVTGPVKFPPDPGHSCVSRNAGLCHEVVR